MKKRKREGESPIWIFPLLFVVITAVLVVVFYKYNGEVEVTRGGRTYSAYYGMIVPDLNSSFWLSVYQGAEQEARNSDVYLELLGQNLSTNYNRSELMKIAIASAMDGIIVVADESDATKELIDEATAQGIPVVTLYSDNSDSARCSYVGISYYNLGKEYGNQVLKLLRNQDVQDKTVGIAVLVNAHSQDSGQNILVSGIQETIGRINDENPLIDKKNIEINLISVDETNDLSIEETIRNLLIGNGTQTPNIIVCLNEIETTTAYQTIVDYNRVGDVNILGYYDSISILKGIERNVIHSTISVDTTQMGAACVEALNEYRELGNTSQYFTADVALVDKTNVGSYLYKEVQP